MKEVLVFSTPACPSCKLLKPILMKLQGKHGFMVRAFELGADTRDLFVKYDVRTAPTMVLVEDGEKTAMFTGFYGEKVLVDRLVQWGVIGYGELTE